MEKRQNGMLAQQLIIIFMLIFMMAGCASQQSLKKAVIQDDAVKAQKIIDKGINPYLKDETGQSALDLAISQAGDVNKLPQWAKNLVEESRKQADAYYLRIVQGKILPETFIQELEKSPFYLDVQTQKHSNTLLFNLVNSDADQAYIQALLAAGANADVTDNQSWTPLIQAVYNGRVSAVKSLISAGANLSMSEKSGWTPLHFTANIPSTGNRIHDVEIAHLLIQAGADINAQDNMGRTPLYLSVSSERSSVMKALIQEEANLNLVDSRGWSPLMMATLFGQVDVVASLIAAGADLNSRGKDGFAALHLTTIPSEESSRDQDVEIALLLIEAGANINVQDIGDSTPLHLSVLNEHTSVLNTLIQRNANLNLVDNLGWSPLMLAVFEGKVDIVEDLIAAGASLAVKTKKDWTALHFTALTTEDGNREHDAEIIHLLIQAGADINAQNTNGNTPLYYSVANNRANVMEILLHEKANVDLADNSSGWSPLHMAVFEGQVNVIKSLIAAGANMRARENNGWTALHFTANSEKNGNRNFDTDISQLLIKAGANPNAVNHKGETPFDLALGYKRYDLVKVLLNNGARDSRYPVKPAKRTGVTSCNTNCNNGSCYRTYDDGRQVHFQAQQRYNALSGQWEYDSSGC